VRVFSILPVPGFIDSFLCCESVAPSIRSRYFKINILKTPYATAAARRRALQAVPRVDPL